MNNTKIKVLPNGPYEVSGDFEITDVKGNIVKTNPRQTIHLCRCGASNHKPFCDGSHRKIGFKDK